MVASSYDAVVVIPGIMGSALRETATGRLVWGLEDPRWYLDAWTRGLGPLHVTEDERSGRTGRIAPAGLLRFPAWAPWLAGFEPYTKLLTEIRKTVVDPAAVLEFAYDWRLSVEHNTGLLAAAAMRHLAEWHAHPAHLAARRRDPDGRPAQLVLVAHSLGGLLAQALTLVPGVTDAIRTSITLGAPFYGSVKAALILNSGRGGPFPLPRKRLRGLAGTLPGLHDLLPTYRCVDTGDDAVRLTPEDVRAIGGDFELAKESAEFHGRVNRSALPGHHSLVGVRQKTAQTVRLRDGVVEPLYRAFAAGLVRRDFQGDGTVYWESAALVEDFHEVAQQHGALPATAEAASLVTSVLSKPGRRPQPLLGTAHLGMTPPDLVRPDREFGFPVTDIGATCQVFDLGAAHPQQPVEFVTPRWADGEPTIRLTLPRPGLYRLVLDSGAQSPVSQIVMAAE